MAKFTAIFFLVTCGVAMLMSIALLMVGEFNLWERWLQFTSNLFGTMSSTAWLWTFIQRDD